MVLIVAFFLPVILFLIYGLPVIRNEGFKNFFGPVFPKVYLPPKGPAEAFLQIEFPYYKALSPKAKHKFFRRLGILLHDKEFVGANGFIVTDEMRYYVLAAWVQVTFGLKRYKMPYFEKIVLHESTFYSSRLGEEVKGLVSLAGVMYLSWADFEKGYKDTADNYNLGIHELSHAFLVSTFNNGDFDIAFSSYIDQWFEATKTEFKNVADSIPSYLRNYAGDNSYEFFSVCMETFFETPQILKDKLPDIYYHLCYLLNQNPLNTSGDYAFDTRVNIGANTAIPLPDKQIRSLKYTGFHWLYLIPIASVVVFLFTLKLYFVTFITLPELLAIFLSAFAIGMVKKIRVKMNDIFGSRMAFLFLITVFCFGLANVIIDVNYAIPTSETKVETHRIVGYKNFRRMNSHRYSNANYYATEFILEDEALDGLGEIRTVDGHTTIEDYHTYVLDISYHYGLFGIKVFDGNRVRDITPE